MMNVVDTDEWAPCWKSPPPSMPAAITGDDRSALPLCFPEFLTDAAYAKMVRTVCAPVSTPPASNVRVCRMLCRTQLLSCVASATSRSRTAATSRTLCVDGMHPASLAQAVIGPRRGGLSTSLPCRCLSLVSRHRTTRCSPAWRHTSMASSSATIDVTGAWLVLRPGIEGRCVIFTVHLVCPGAVKRRTRGDKPGWCGCPTCCACTSSAARSGGTATS